MGLFDFAKNAGAKLGIGKSTGEEKAEKLAAAAKVAAEKAAVQAAAVKSAKEAAVAVKSAQDAFSRTAAEKTQKDAQAAAAAAKAEADKAAAELHAEASKSSELEAFVGKLGLNVKDLDVRFDDGCAIVSGQCATQADLEKVVLAIGNVGEVNQVIELMGVDAPAAEPDSTEYHTVVSGDTLSKIAKHFYGDAAKYPLIFEANRPMLKDADAIFPGQMLRIPALA
jgi:nucleoid-associated protein YgaU